MRYLLAVGALALFIGCDIVLGVEEHSVVGITEGFDEGDPYIQVPDTVAVGEPFTVTIRTYADGCTRMGDTEVDEVDEDDFDLTVTPYDVVRGDGGPLRCADGPVEKLEHEATMRIDEPGTTAILFRGRAVSEGYVADSGSRVYGYPRHVVVR